MYGGQHLPKYSPLHFTMAPFISSALDFVHANPRKKVSYRTLQTVAIVGTSGTSAAAAVSSQPPAASGSATSSYLMAQMPKSEKKPVLRPAVFDKVINFSKQ